MTLTLARYPGRALTALLALAVVLRAIGHALNPPKELS